LTSIAGEVIVRITGMEQETVAQFLSVMPLLAPITIGGQAIIRFYNAATDEEKLIAAASLSEILRQIDEGRARAIGSAAQNPR
jgi:hypothetical protein